MKDHKEAVISLINNKYPNKEGQIRTICPACSHTRNKKNEKCLAVNTVDKVYYCHHCEIKGSLLEGEYRTREFKKPQPSVTQVNDPDYFQAFAKSRDIRPETFEKLGITYAYTPPEVGLNGMPAIAFPYIKDGEIVNRKYRVQFKDGNKTYRSEKDCELPFFNLDGLIMPNGNPYKYAIITEGELDCAAIVDAGIPAVVSIPSGSKSAIKVWEAYEGYFENCERIFVCFDNDAPGLNAAYDLVEAIGDRAHFVRIPEQFKDVNEFLKNIPRKDKLRSITEVLSQAIKYFPAGIKTIRADVSGNMIDELDDVYYNGYTSGALTTNAELNEYLKFSEGGLTLITGHSGSGKTNFAIQLAQSLHQANRWKFGCFSSEDSPKVFFFHRLIEMETGKRLSKGEYYGLSKEEYEWAKEKVKNYAYLVDDNPDIEEGSNLDYILTMGSYLIEKEGIKLYIIDHWMNIEHDNDIENPAVYTPRVLKKIRKWAQLNKIHVILLAHPRKTEKDGSGNLRRPTAMDVSGSISFWQLSDNLVVVHRKYVEQDNKLSSTSEIYFDKIKKRTDGKQGKIELDYDVSNHRYHGFYDYVEHITLPEKQPVYVNNTEIDTVTSVETTKTANSGSFVSHHHKYHHINEHGIYTGPIELGFTAWINEEQRKVVDKMLASVNVTTLDLLERTEMAFGDTDVDFRLTGFQYADPDAMFYRPQNYKELIC